VDFFNFEYSRKFVRVPDPAHVIFGVRINTISNSAEGYNFISS